MTKLLYNPIYISYLNNNILLDLKIYKLKKHYKQYINYNYNVGNFSLSNLNNKLKILVSSPDDNIFNITFNSNTYQYLNFSENISTNKKNINFNSDYFTLSNKSLTLNNSKSSGEKIFSFI